MFSALLLLLASLSWAQSPSHLNLDTYIEMMNLKALPVQIEKREHLYQLGLRLFYDKRLSGNNNISCHDCHSIAGYSGDNLPLAIGEGANGFGHRRLQANGKVLSRHTPPLYNSGLPGVMNFFWDGRVSFYPGGGWLTPVIELNGPQPKFLAIAKGLDSLLAVQALFPLITPDEMLGQGSQLSPEEAWNGVMERLLRGKSAQLYQRLFRDAYPEAKKYNIAHVANALAEFQRHFFLATNTPWDQYLRGNKTTLSQRMKRGATLFLGKAACTNCHVGDHFSSFGFQNIGVPQIGPGVSDHDDRGRMEATGSQDHLYRFKVMPLRNVALTAPYMHSGAFKDMWEVIEHYNHPMASLHHFQWDIRHPAYQTDLPLETENNRQRAQTLAANLPRNLRLTQEEKTDLYCFLMVALTDVKHHGDLVKKGLIDEIDDCSPLTPQ